MCGVSDGKGVFHLIAVALCSFITQREYQNFFLNLNDLYNKLFHRELLKPDFLMMDHSDAERNAAIYVWPEIKEEK